MPKEVLTNDLEMEKDEAKLVHAKKRAGNAQRQPICLPTSSKYSKHEGRYASHGLTDGRIP